MTGSRSSLTGKTAKKINHAPVTKVGYGVGIKNFSTNNTTKKNKYDINMIKAAAKDVKTKKEGVCHTFAQLGAELLLDQTLNHSITGMSIKIVSHKEGSGSHTFLLINYNGDNLDIKSPENKNVWENCVIVDPWAAAMGHRDTHGVFGVREYPYPFILTDLEVVYD